jgi:hypothetical protein
LKRSLQLNPDNRPATWAQIKHWRDTHETAPVTTSLGVFDCDERSDARMAQAIEAFNSLPTVSNGLLSWKRADNTWVDLSLDDLQTAYREVKVARAYRAAWLHQKAEVFRQRDPAPTPAELSSIDYWLL